MRTRSTSGFETNSCSVSAVLDKYSVQAPRLSLAIVVVIVRTAGHAFKLILPKIRFLASGSCLHAISLEILSTGGIACSTDEPMDA
jgi:hypothetical protein